MLVQEIMENLELGNYGNEITNYGENSYICDAVSEIADSNTSIYYSDIMSFISNDPESVNEAIQEFGWEGCGSDLYKAGQMAEYLTIEREIYNNLDDVIMYYALDYYQDHYSKDITDERLEDLKGELSSIDNNDKLYRIIDAVDGLFSDQEEEE